MDNKEDEDYYHSLSRRELQDLCKKNGLPANRTKFELAKLLASCSQKKDVSLEPLEGRSSCLIDGWPCTSPVLISKPESELNPMRETNKGIQAADVDSMKPFTCSKAIGYDEISVSTMGVVRNDPTNNGKAEVYGCFNVESKETAGCSPLGSQCDYVGPKVKSKETSRFIEVRDCDQNLMGSTRSNGSGKIYSDIPTDSNFVSSNGVDMKLVPSFEFYVRSEEGINLFVDLNSGPSDWIHNLNNGVCIHPIVPNNKSWALHDDLRNFRGGEEEAKASVLKSKVVDIQNKRDSMFTSSSLSSIVRECRHVKADQHSEADRSSRSIAVMCKNTPVDVVGGIEDHNHMKKTICRSNFDSHCQLDMCTILSPQKSKKITLGTEVPLAPQVIAIDSHGRDPKSDGLKSLDSIRGNAMGALCGCSTSAADLFAMQLSEGASHSENISNLPYQNGGEPDLDIAVAVNDLPNEIERSTNCELDLNKCLCPISECLEERLQGRTNITNETVIPDCSQFDMLPRNCKRSHCSDSDGLQNKRQYRHDDDCKFPSILRNSKDLARDVYPRRSMRLVSK
ncbi:Degv domain-containing protein [Thalictrum thalictroides]|uniref:Degv domain-containing protein n=1 Tax=Thalictrum thalictroides TaxID=46969 RepID=A0A7J6WCL0_THATH|nr:Degv domain-containing protein [Thalictrum thalictroides]